MSRQKRKQDNHLTEKQMPRLLVGMYSYLSRSEPWLWTSLRIVVQVQRLLLTWSNTSACCFLSQCTCITPSTYLYTPFSSNLVLAKSLAVGKMSRRSFIACSTGHILRGHVAIITKPESTISGPWRSIAWYQDFCLNFLHSCKIKSGSDLEWGSRSTTVSYSSLHWLRP